jgi:surface protein
MFNGSTNFNSDLSNWGNQLQNVTTMSGLLGLTTGFTSDISLWDTSAVTDMSYLFSDTTNFNIDLSWNITNVQNMQGLFYGSSGFNCDLSGWANQLHNVTDMSYLLDGVTDFMTDLSLWDTSSVTDMSFLFSNTSNFSNTFVNNWNISSVTNMSGLFYNVTNFIVDLSWNMSNATNFSYLFAGSIDFNNNFVESWNVSNVVNMSYLFSGSSGFNCDLSGWATQLQNTNTIAYMFGTDNSFVGEMTNFNGIGLDTWDTSKIIIMTGLFARCRDFSYNFVESWDTSSVTDISYLFWSTDNFTSDISGWNTNNVTTMSHLFNAASNFNLDLSNWGTNLNSLTDISNMFSNQISFTNSSIKDWNVSNVENMDSIFSFDKLFGMYLIKQPDDFKIDLNTANMNSSNLSHQTTGFEVDLSNWDVSKIQTTSLSFNAINFNNLDKPYIFNGTGLNKWKTSSLQNMSYMFSGTIGLDATFTKDWNVSNVHTMEGLCSNSNSLKLDVSKFDTKNVTNLSHLMNGLDRLHRFSLNNIQNKNIQNNNIITPTMKSLPLSIIAGIKDLNTSNVTTIAYAAANTHVVTGQEFENLIVEKVTDMTGFASNSNNFNPNLNKFLKQLKRVTTASGAFANTTSFTGKGLSNLNASSLTNADVFIAGAKNLGVKQSNMSNVNMPKLLSSVGFAAKSSIDGMTSMLPPQVR